MFITFIIFIPFFIWLLKETNWLRINLCYILEPKLAVYRIHYKLKGKSKGPDGFRGNIPGIENMHNAYCLGDSVKCYDVYLSPGIDNVLCGWQWLDTHCADQVDYTPKVYLATGNGVRYTMTIKHPEIIPAIMKVNRMSSKQKKLAYAGI
jgi:hypothetical protein